MKITTMIAALSVALFCGQAAHAYTLTTGGGDGDVTIDVDDYGAFGTSAVNTFGGAVFDPVGAVAAAQTTYESFVYIGTPAAGTRSNLTDGTITTGISGSTTSATSAFTFGSYSVALTQTVASTTTGAVLTQEYAFTSMLTSGTDVFDLVRYVDGDLQFDGSITDGGGRLESSGTEILFETDTATGSSDEATFVGIAAVGGTIPDVGRYEIDSFSGLRSRIESGTALDDMIAGDSADADEFIDSGSGYDVTMALMNSFSVAAGATATYTTYTYFGTEAPTVLVERESGDSVPEPGTMMLLGASLIGFAAYRRRKQC